MEAKSAFVIVSLLIGFTKFLPYFFLMWQGKVKPHAFSWATWGINNGLAFTLSVMNGGGGGAWVLGMVSIICLSIAVWAIFKGERHITSFDTIIFSAALVSLFFYASTQDAATSAVLAAMIDVLGFIPTIRKSYASPHSESAVTYTFSFLSVLVSLGALNTYTFVTTCYPVATIVANSLFVAFLLIRRSSLQMVQANPGISRA